MFCTCYIHSKNELAIAFSAIGKSFDYIREAIKNNENTWMVRINS